MSRAPIYSHFTETETHFFCNYCQCKYVKDKSKSTGNLHKHFNRHRRENPELSDVDILSVSLPLAKKGKSQSVSSDATPIPVKPAQDNRMPEQTEAIVRFFTAFDIPFEIVESEEFRTMLDMGTFFPELPSCNDLVENFLPKVADKTRDSLKKKLNGVSVALGFNEFNDGQDRYMSVTASHIQNWRVITTRLDVCSLMYDNPDMLKQRIDEKLEEYGIEAVLGATHNGGDISHIAFMACGFAGWNEIVGFDNLINKAVSKALSIENRVKAEIDAVKSVVDLSNLNFLVAETNDATRPATTDWYSILVMLESYIQMLPLLTVPEGCQVQPDIAFLQKLCEMLHYFEQLNNMSKGRDAYASLIPYLYLRLHNYCNKPNMDPELKNFANIVASVASEFYAINYEPNRSVQMCCLFDPRFAFNNLILPKAVWDSLKSELTAKYPDTVADMQEEVPSTSDDWAPLVRSNVKSKMEVELDQYKSEKRLPVPSPTNKNNQDVLDFWERHEGEFPLLASEMSKHLCLLSSSSEPEHVFRDLSRLISNTTNNAKPETIRDVETIRLEAARRKMDKNLRSQAAMWQ